MMSAAAKKLTASTPNDHGEAEEQPSQRGTDEFVGQHLGRGQTRAGPNQVVGLDGARH